ncbi:glycerate kinase [Cupriavidus sp. P-10]|uniref:glycerate kinase n=1 Tax=Cupriavidus sp. P-10 TaxID=2027911 RepID=UPI000E2E4D24|nr:glycerate kinase [Cupriavidus sp. P-10]BDB27293.1 glycerate kinase [Cupriavidus sp. P-10]
MSEAVFRVLVAPDSFKGSLGASAVADRIRAGIIRAVPGADVVLAPIADGGEGTAEVMAATLPGKWDEVRVVEANGMEKAVRYYRGRCNEFGEIAILEVAEVVGLPQAVAEPGKRTTRGIGQAIRHLASQGVNTIAIGLGGSSTNEAGAGMLSELGFRFVDGNGKVLCPILENLQAIREIGYERPESLAGVRMIALSDVNSPLCGPTGATYVFGPQKGVTALAAVDATLAGFAKRCTAALGVDFTEAEGSGAAGGIGFALRLLGAEVVSGATFVLRAAGLHKDLNTFDWMITGEGRSDVQTMMGKGPATIAYMAREAGVPVTLLSGGIDPSPALTEAFDGCISIQQGPVSLNFAMEHAGALLEEASHQLTRLFASGSRRNLAASSARR